MVIKDVFIDTTFDPLYFFCQTVILTIITRYAEFDAELPNLFSILVIGLTITLLLWTIGCYRFAYNRF
jgi:hypothetical protein